MQIEVELREKFRDGDGGAYAHDTWGETGESGGDVFGENGLLELEGFGTFHEKEGCGAICDLGTVAGGTAVAVLWKGTGEFGDFLVGGAVADFVFGNGRFLAIQSDGDGDELVLEEACFIGSFGTAVGLGCIFVLLLTADVELLGDNLRSTYGRESVHPFREGPGCDQPSIPPMGIMQSLASALAIISSANGRSSRGRLSLSSSAPTAIPHSMMPV